MKVLILAYACSPSRGSEPKVGWDSVAAIAETHSCWVITSTKFKSEIETRLKEESLANASFVYHGPDFTWIGNGLLARVQTWFLYKQWQASVLSVAERLCGDVHFDVVHHITITGWRVPPRAWSLPAPFVWGPVGGTAEVPRQFSSQLSLTARCFELVRRFHSYLGIHAPSFTKCVRATSVLLAANRETKTFFERHGLSAPILNLPAVYFSSTRVQELKRPSLTRSSGPLHLFAGGTLQGSKGISLAIRALARVREAGMDFRYIIAGHGPEIRALRKLIRDLGLSKQVSLLPPFTGAAYVAQLHASDVYLMPSFRETTPVTLLEAMLAGCYPVVADISAPGEIVRELGGRAIACGTVDELVSGIANAITEIASRRSEIATEARTIAERTSKKYSQLNYAHVVNTAYEIASVKIKQA
jgi:hypothetical protein